MTALKKTVELLPQKDFDDPALDASFPEHALSRVRAELRAVAAGSQVLRPAPPFSDTLMALPRIGCAVQSPPGFVHIPNFDEAREGFRRTSFCGTDGVETFLVERRDQRVKLSHLRKTAESETRALHPPSGGVRNLELAVEELGAHVLVVAEGDGEGGRLRNALLWFIDSSGRLALLALLSAPCIPVAVLADELMTSARTFHAT